MKEYSELRRLAEAATKCYGAMRVEKDYNGVYQVVGAGSWNILSAWHTPDGKSKDNAEFHAAASPAAVLELIAEVEALKAERDYCRRVADHNLDLGVQYMNERDQAKTDNELLRAEINHLKPCPLYSTRMNSKRYLWLRDSHIGDDPESINLECGPNNGLDSAIDAAMSNKE